MRYLLVQARGSKSQRQLARELQISRSYYVELEKGTKNPSVRVLSKLVACLGPSILPDFLPGNQAAGKTPSPAGPEQEQPPAHPAASPPGRDLHAVGAGNGGAAAG